MVHVGNVPPAVDTEVWRAGALGWLEGCELCDSLLPPEIEGKFSQLVVKTFHIILKQRQQKNHMLIRAMDIISTMRRMKQTDSVKVPLGRKNCQFLFLSINRFQKQKSKTRFLKIF